MIKARFIGRDGIWGPNGLHNDEGLLALDGIEISGWVEFPDETSEDEIMQYFIDNCLGNKKYDNVTVEISNVGEDNS